MQILNEMAGSDLDKLQPARASSRASRNNAECLCTTETRLKKRVQGGGGGACSESHTREARFVTRCDQHAVAQNEGRSTGAVSLEEEEASLAMGL